LNLQMLQLTSHLELDSSNLYNIMVHLFGEKLADQLSTNETMVWVQNGTHNVFCNCWWGWWLGLEEQWGKGMDLVFIIPHFILAKRMDALDAFWQLTTSSKTICDEIEWILFFASPNEGWNFALVRPSDAREEDSTLDSYHSTFTISVQIKLFFVLSNLWKKFIICVNFLIVFKSSTVCLCLNCRSSMTIT
jgi:hypothetical protein